MDVAVLLTEIWIYLKVLVQVFGIILLPDDATTTITTSSLRLNSEWGQPWGSEVWISSVTCRIYLPFNYTPQDEQQGFSIKIILEEYAISIHEIFYPLDRTSVRMTQLNGAKEFLIRTAGNIWEYSGWKDYQIHIKFINKDLTMKGRWPRGTCSGPYSLD